jgi:hypothetical protein
MKHLLAKSKCRKKSHLIFFLICNFLIINSTFITQTTSNSTFEIALGGGSYTFEVKHFDKELWNSIVDNETDPSSLFEGTADSVGAISKFVTIYVGENDLSSRVMFSKLMFRWLNIPFESLLVPNGFNSSYINERYTYYYKMWDITFGYWNFTTTEFEHDADYTIINPGIPKKHVYVLKNPSNFSRLLGDYNDFATVVNIDAEIQAANYSMPLLDGDSFIWYLVLDGTIVAKPFDDYLNQLIVALDCINTTSQDNRLLLHRKGLGAYDIEITYNEYGMFQTLVFKTLQNNIIYLVEGSSSHIPVNLTVIIIVLGVVGVILLHTFLRFKKRRDFQMQLSSMTR